uniref:uncharacterized protein LOC105350720 n=1 Tax=Fragaria vesca subsp. vesca TaxID=101020 RepID=UPI0005CA9EF8|nr:PREDICTED: uncharacterized protein LOC105350720 [Fragaria vesca subsp. vesca]XP_011461884.1 PREDICTED: uncharacterized protein LOC105350720 [Fragaria vesca subsp. vesca]XP_011461885.1 PREDICTED: uncharacterized protein LOC105350720 [Fragaria vesca subsp. vesca]
MAAAIRSMIGKVGNTRSVRNDVTSFPISNPHLHLGYSSRHPLDLFPVVHHPRNQRLPKKSEPDSRPSIPEMPYLGTGPINDSSRDCPRVVINAHFALEEFNKQKNAQLQFVRVVKAYNQECGGAFNHLMLTLEAIDANNVIQIYQAIVKQFWIAKRPLLLLLFGLVADNGNWDLIKLIDNRGVFGPGPTDNRCFGRRIKIQKTQRCSLEEEILSTLHLPLK